MAFTTLNIKRAYSSDIDDIVKDFYIPVLQNAVEYQRLAGFFSSTSLAIAAKGILGLIKNGGSYKLIVSTRLSKSDVEILMNSSKREEEFIEEKMLTELSIVEEDFVKDHLFALGWLVANKKLEIRVAITYNKMGQILNHEEVEKTALFHQKVGILKDGDGNILSFSGSINETAKGWLENVEEFKVFRSWEVPEQYYISVDTAKFNRYWFNESSCVKTIDVPQAVKKKLISIAPKNIDELNLKKWYTDQEKKEEIRLYDYQNDAITEWLNNDKRGIFEMATGTGKTYTALGCLRESLQEIKQLTTIIACPFNHLVKQWHDKINKFNIPSDVIVADKSNTKWKNQLTDALLDQKNGIIESLIVLTTHDTFPALDFQEILVTYGHNIFLIVDEVHGIGAPKRKQGLTNVYRYRLGLSATPKRWFDYEGTEELFAYFGDVVYRFPLKKAIQRINPQTGKTFLCRYDYKPYFVELTEEEIYEYERETAKIAQAYHRSKSKEERSKWFSLMLINRQKIIRNATNKLRVFKEILNDINRIQDCLVYCSPEQIEAVQNILNSYSRQNIIQHKFTSKESVTAEDKYDGMSEREYLLKNFRERLYHVLVAIKCLDEGVDIPSVKTAIILASTGNPREYVQRRGRVLRHSADKKKAIIYDVIVIPNISGKQDAHFVELEKKIFQKELVRYKEFSSIAANALECFDRIDEMEDKLDVII